MDMNSLDLNLLKSLHVLLVERSVTGAARRIGISQPAMSAQLARLRRQFGDPLLVPSGRSLVPTVRAEALQEPLEAILQDLVGLVQTQSTFDPLSAQDTVFLGGIDYVHAMISGDLAVHLRVEAPGIRLAMMPFVHGSLARDLETGRMSAAIVTSFVRLDQAKSVTLQSERFAFVQRCGHPRGKAPPTLNEFCNLQHVLVSPEGGGFSGAVDQALDDLGRKRHVAVSLPSFLLAPDLIAASDLVGVLPQRLARRHEAVLDVLPIPFDLQGFDLLLIWHVRRHHDPAHQWFRRQLTSFLRDRRGQQG